MKTQKCTQGWRSYLTSSSLILLCIVVLLILKTLFAIERDSDNISNYINKNIVVLINDEIVVDRKVKNDTVNIYLNTHKTDTVKVSIEDTLTNTIVLDTINKR